MKAVCEVNHTSVVRIRNPVKPSPASVRVEPFLPRDVSSHSPAPFDSPAMFVYCIHAPGHRVTTPDDIRTSEQGIKVLTAASPAIPPKMHSQTAGYHRIS